MGMRVATEITGLFLIAIAMLGAVALFSYHPADPVFEFAPVMNRVGVVGATFSAVIYRSVGWAGLVLVVAMGIVGARLIVGRDLGFLLSRIGVGFVLLVVSMATLPVLLAPLWSEVFIESDGGVLGTFLAHYESLLFSSFGALFLNCFLFVVGISSAVGIAPRSIIVTTASVVEGCVHGIAIGVSRFFSGLRALLQGTKQLFTRAVEGVRVWTEVWRERRARRERVVAYRENESSQAGADAEAAVEAIREPVEKRKSGKGPHIVDHRKREAEREPTQEAFTFSEQTPEGPYQFPEINVFDKPPQGTRAYDRDSLIMNSRILEKKLLDFGVAGRVVTVHPGPVITMYEFEPASGIKLNRIVGLSDDLALALRALSIRIIAPLPGKSVVGIEVPNSERDTVYIRDVMESDSYRSSHARLSIALGKDIFGTPIYADLARMPHLLVAGATGTGKSVFLNSLLCSVLFRASPQDLKLLLIDPKLLELSIYEGIPHLIADVVTNPKRAAAALHGVVAKMEERYQMMAALGVRSIDQFNERVKEELEKGNEFFRLKAKPGEEEGTEIPLHKLPYIIVVVDELADLMVVAGRDVEEALQRLAQMARAAGIHLVLATQRPSVDVLTGVIKANFPARISFQVSSRTDSRTILDQNGAEHLLGQGDMLFLPPGTSKMQRIHGGFVSEKEVGRLVEFLRIQGKPVFDESLLKAKEESEAKEKREDVDEMFDQAIAIVAETRNASISYLQRRLKVGYNRAARMIEQMEEEGMIGPQEGAKSREVFLRSPDLDVE